MQCVAGARRSELAVISREKMSAEPGRRAAYQVDVHWRIVWQRITKELSFSEISCRLNVSSSTAYRIFRLFVQTGDVQPKNLSESRRRLRKLDDSMEMFILGVVLETPSIYLTELCVLKFKK